MNVLGTPSENDLSFITDPTALQYIKEFPTGQQMVDFKSKFPYASDEALDLMIGMVQFNPFFRYTIEDCLAHPYFKKIRRKDREIKQETMVDISLDKFEEEPDIMTLRKICIQEINHYKKLKEQYGVEHFFDHV